MSTDVASLVSSAVDEIVRFRSANPDQPNGWVEVGELKIYIRIFDPTRMLEIGNFLFPDRTIAKQFIKSLFLLLRQPSRDTYMMPYLPCDLAIADFDYAPIALEALEEIAQESKGNKVTIELTYSKKLYRVTWKQ